MDNKFIVRLAHGYFNGGVETLPEACPTIDAHVGCWYILIGEKMKNEEIKCNCVGMLGGKYEKLHDIARRVYDTNGIAPTQHTCGGGNLETKIVEPLALDEQNGYIRQDGTVGTLTTDGSSPKHNNRIIENYRIRKLTPKECWRLMGFDDSDFEKAEKVNSNTQLYKQAGNSIVVDVICYIFGNLLESGILGE